MLIQTHYPKSERASSRYCIRSRQVRWRAAAPSAASPWARPSLADCAQLITRPPRSRRAPGLPALQPRRGKIPARPGIAGYRTVHVDPAGQHPVNAARMIRDCRRNLSGSDVVVGAPRGVSEAIGSTIVLTRSAVSLPSVMAAFRNPIEISNDQLDVICMTCTDARLVIPCFPLSFPARRFLLPAPLTGSHRLPPLLPASSVTTLGAPTPGRKAECPEQADDCSTSWPPPR